jgi:endoglucanase
MKTRMNTLIRLLLTLNILYLAGCAGEAEDPAWMSIDYSTVEAITVTSSLPDPSAAVPPVGSPVDLNGQLRIDTGQLVNEDGDPVQLKGMSAFWINWTPGGDYVNPEVIEWLVDDWGITVYRVAIGVDPDDAYLDNPGRIMPMVTGAIDACIEQGIYVIVDWHAHDNLDYGVEEGAFFKGIAETYGDCPNIIYEVWNEPLEENWSREIQPFCTNLIDNAIRPIDTDNIILVGTSSWSQDVDQCVSKPIDDVNTMYVLHFYAGTHGASLRGKAETALNAGLPLFVSEWGTSTSNGGAVDGVNDNTVYYDLSDTWISWMDDHTLSWCNWSLSDKDESSAALMPDAPADPSVTPWTDTHLSPAGEYVRGKIRE